MHSATNSHSGGHRSQLVANGQYELFPHPTTNSRNNNGLLRGQEDLNAKAIEQIVDRRLDPDLIVGAPVVSMGQLEEQPNATGKETRAKSPSDLENENAKNGKKDEVRTTHFMTGGRIVQKYKNDQDETKFVFDYGKDGHIQTGDSKLGRSAVIREQTADFIRRGNHTGIFGVLVCSSRNRI